MSMSWIRNLVWKENLCTSVLGKWSILTCSVCFLRLRLLSTFLSPNNHLILVLKLLVEKMTILCKPGAEKETPWHQDQPYYPVDGRGLVGLTLQLNSPYSTSLLHLFHTSWISWISPCMWKMAQTECTDQVSLWMPVDPVSLDSAVKFVRGSHR